MICNNCGCKIKGNPYKCPLCDHEFGKPKKTKKKKGVGLYKNPFTLIYIIATVAVAFVVYFVGTALNWTKSAFIGCLLALFPVYYAIRHTRFGMRNKASKLTSLQFVISTYLVILLEITEFFGGYYIIFTTFQTALFLTTAILVLSKFRVYYPYTSCFIVHALISWIPVIRCIIELGSMIYPLTVAIVETIFALYFVVVYPKETLNQIKRFFAV